MFVLKKNILLDFIKEIIKNNQCLNLSKNILLIVKRNLNTTITAAYLINIQSKAGSEGGQILVVRTPKDIMKDKSSGTTTYLNGDQQTNERKTRLY